MLDAKYFEILITVFLAVISWIVIREIKRIDGIENENKLIKENYLDRFENISSKLNDMHTDIALIKNDLLKN